MDKAISDPAWLKWLSRYDDAGIETLFGHYYVPLVLFAVSYVRDNDVAKDIVQDVFLVMIQKKEKFATIDNLRTYLYSTVKNRCLKHFRHEEVRMRYGRYVTESQSEEEDYHERILEEEVFQLLQKSVDELPEQCRKVFRLALDGKDNAEIANMLGVGVETVKSHKKSGKKILAGKLRGFMCYPGLFFFF